MGRITDGWRVSDVTVIQSGYPFTVYTSQAFIPSKDANGNYVRDASGNIVPAAGNGDYNADGYNNDYPNVPDYTQPTSRTAYLAGLWPSSRFAAPVPGVEGNELQNQYRNPNYNNSDLSLSKSTAITEFAKLTLRGDFFNFLNHPNLQPVNGNLSSATFGKSTSQYNPRWILVGANISF